MSFENIDEYTVMLAEAYAKDAYHKGYEQGKKDAIKHGHWIDTGRGDHYFSKQYRCSCCNSVDYMRAPYCYNCGARMDGDKHGTN